MMLQKITRVVLALLLSCTMPGLCMEIRGFNQQASQRFLKAAKEGEVTAVLAALEEQADPNTVEPSGSHTPLHLAAKNGHSETVKQLILHGANINAQDRRGSTPLILALKGKEGFMQSHSDIVRLLTENGADPNIGMHSMYIFKASPLSVSLWHNDFSLAQLLLKHGASPQSVADEPRRGSPLQQVCRMGAKLECLQILFDYGADIGDGDWSVTASFENVHRLSLAHRRLLLEYGAHMENPRETLQSLIQELFSQSSKTVNKDKSIENALAMAVGQGQTETVKRWLASFKTAVNQSALKTAMSRAAATGRIEIFMNLVQHSRNFHPAYAGIIVDAMTEALSQASVHRHIGLVVIILDIDLEGHLGPAIMQAGERLVEILRNRLLSSEYRSVYEKIHVLLGGYQRAKRLELLLRGAGRQVVSSGSIQALPEEIRHMIIREARHDLIEQTAVDRVLVQAAAEGDCDTLRSIISRDDICVRIDALAKALFYACLNLELEAIELILALDVETIRQLDMSGVIEALEAKLSHRLLSQIDRNRFSEVLMALRARKAMADNNVETPLTETDVLVGLERRWAGVAGSSMSLHLMSLHLKSLWGLERTERPTQSILQWNHWARGSLTF